MRSKGFARIFENFVLHQTDSNARVDRWAAVWRGPRCSINIQPFFHTLPSYIECRSRREWIQKRLNIGLFKVNLPTLKSFLLKGLNYQIKRKSFYKPKTALATKLRVIFISVQSFFVALQAKTSRKDCFVP